MEIIDPERTVAELVTEMPGRARVFERLGVDYCCGGGRSLASSCIEKHLELELVLAELAGAGDDVEEPGRDWRSAQLGELCDHIVGTHHRYLRDELPLLGELVGKVARAHGGGHPELFEVEQVFVALADELQGHMLVEEDVVFPSCRTLEEGHPELVALAGPVRAMELDHRETGTALENLRRLTGDYEPPAGACNSYRAMLERLERLERDVHRHIHEEENILFPRALELEAWPVTAA